MWHARSWMTPLVLTAALLALATPTRAADDLETLREQAIKTALKKVSPSVVTIETSGGTDIIVVGPANPRGGGGGAKIRKGTGPTTGLIVSADGYVITSAFNFANNPSSIFVSVAGHTQKYVGKVIATDQTRMLTLLKIEVKDLPVPTAVPKKDIRVGQTVLAVGRTLAQAVDHPPSVSEGIISAVGRIWGKALQTDAKISPTNYGGPLTDLEGKVLGVLVPASPRTEGQTAGFEWYDSGIGFAIPLEDINQVLPRLKQGKDLTRGVLGVTMQGADQFGTAPVVGTVAAASAAEQTGLKAGDIIKEINGKAVLNYAQVLHQLGTHYEGDAITIKIERGGKEQVFNNVKLGGAVAAFGQIYLGILPMRDDPEPGVEIRYVYPKSPAETAKLQIGDRITKVGPAQGNNLIEVKSRDDLSRLLATARPNAQIKLEVIPKGEKKAKTVTVALTEMPETVPAELPEKSSKEKALTRKGTPAPPKKEDKKDDKKEDEKKIPTGLINRMNAAQDHKYWLYVPDDYNPEISYSLVIWLHPVGKNREKDVKQLVSDWEDYCSKNHIILVGPNSENDAGWIASEVEFVLEAAKFAMENYTIDRRRVVAHGMGLGGQLAIYLGFSSRDLVRGVATVGAVPNQNPKERVPTQPLRFFIVTGEKDPIKEAVNAGQAKLAEYKYPVIYRVLKEKGHQYFDEDSIATLKELVRWIDSLDRM